MRESQSKPEPKIYLCSETVEERSNRGSSDFAFAE